MSHRTFLAAVGFTAALVAFEGLVLHQHYVDYLFGPFPSELPRRHLVLSVTFVLLGHTLTMCYVWASLMAAARVRLLYFLLFALAVFVQYGYYDALRGYATPADFISAIWGANNELRRAMIATYVGWRGLVPATAYALLLFLTPRTDRSLRAPAILIGGLGLATALTVVPAQVTAYQGYPTTSVGGFFVSWMGVVWQWRQYSRETPVVHRTPATTPSNNIVFIIEESLRPDHMSLNGYRRPTTPTLDALNRDGRITNWGTAVAGANCSVASNELLWVGLSATDLPARRGEPKTWPSIMQYAKSMGYRTTYLDGLWSYFWIGDSFDLRQIDSWIPPDRQTEGFQHDVAIARQVRRIVDSSTGNFIWISKRGIHWPYTVAFPPSAAVWTPSATDQSTWFKPNQIPSTELANAYDNAIFYNVDGFFRELDIEHRRPGTVFLYTSDHGQSLSERGEPWLHCSDRRGGSAKRDLEASVPLLMIVAGEKARDAGLAVNRASHANVFATLLDLMHIPVEDRAHAYGPSLVGADPFQFRPRYYFLGDGITGTSPFGGLVRFDD